MAPKIRSDSDVGGDYEVYFLAYLSLICLLNDDVEDFEIESNSQDFGKFGNCVVRVIFKSGQKETICIQLKHKENPYIATVQLEKDKGNFSIQSYYDSFKEIKDKDKTNFIYILFTNGKIKADNINKLKKFTIRKGLNFEGFHKILKTTKNVYQFFDKSELNDSRHQIFFNNFYFYSKQENETQLYNSIYKIFKKEFGSNEDVGIKFIQFFKNLQEGTFTDKKIQKRTVEMHLIYLLLKPFIVEVYADDSIYNNTAYQYFEKIILLFDFTLLQNIKLQTALIKTPSVIREHFVKWTENHKFVNCKGNSLLANDELQTLYCCCEHKIPFYLKYNEKSVKSINAVVRLKQNSNANCMKFILIGSEKSLAHFIKNENTLSSLLDIEKKNREVYENIINNFGISIEDRNKMVLKDFIQIDDELTEIITVDLLVHALKVDNIIKVGKAKEDTKLPDFYIPREVYQYGVSLEGMKQNRNILFVIHCESYLEFVEQSLGNNCITLDELSGDTALHCNKNIVLTAKSNYIELSEEINLNNFTKNKRIKKVHHLYLYHNRNSTNPNVDWFRSGEIGNSINSSDVDTFSFHQKSLKAVSNTDDDLDDCLNSNLLSKQEIASTKFLQKLTVKEEDIFSHFTNEVELICGRPGVGKSRLMSNLRLNCSENYWCVGLNFKDIDSYFVTELSYDEFCNKIYYNKNDSPLVKKIKDMYYRQNKIIFFFDDFDELASGNFKNFITLLDEIQSDKKCKVWISTRLNCRHFFEKKIKGSAIEFKEIQESDQRCFIENKLKSHCQSNERVKGVVNNVFHSLYVSKNKDFLSTPILLHVVTDVLINRNLEEIPTDIFILTKMYERFFKGKILHYLAKFAPKDQDWLNKTIKNHFQTYEIAALKACLTSVLLDLLKIKVDKHFINVPQIDPIGILISTQNDGDKFSFKFHHQTYAEYFAAKWLAKNINEIPYDSRAFLLKERYENLKLMFDMLMADNCKAHIAVLYKNVAMLKECNEDDVRKKDKLGRSVLHLLFLSGEKFPLQPSDCLIEGNEINPEIFFFEPDSTIKNLLECLENPEIPLRDRDNFLDKSAIDYAVSRFSISLLAHIAKLEKFNFDLAEQVRDNLFLIVFYSLSCGYLSMLKLETVDKYLRHNLNSTTLIKLLFSSNKTESYTMTALTIASKNGHFDVVKYLLSKNADVNLRMNDGVSPLYVASQNGHLKVVKELLSRNADVNLTTNDGESPLYIASEYSYLNIVKELLSMNSDVNLKNRHGVSPLFIASQEGQVDVVKELLSNNADVNLARNDGASPTLIASYHGHIDIVKELLSSNADVNLSMNDGSSPILIASYHGHLDVVKELLSKNADVNLRKNDGATPLYVASQEGHFDTVKELISKNADINLATKKGESPLYIASKNGHFHVVKELLNENADVNLTRHGGASALFVASHQGHLDVVRELLGKNADVNLTTENRASPLLMASANEHFDVVKELLSKNADVNLAMNDGTSPLYVASQNGYIDIVKELISKSADVNLTIHNGTSSLYIASQNGHFDVVKELVSSNADVNLTRVCGASPLFVASSQGHIDIVKALLSKNADVNLTMNDCSPLSIALRNGHQDVVKELLSKNASSMPI